MYSPEMSKVPTNYHSNYLSTLTILLYCLIIVFLTEFYIVHYLKQQSELNYLSKNDFHNYLKRQLQENSDVRQEILNIFTVKDQILLRRERGVPKGNQQGDADDDDIFIESFEPNKVTRLQAEEDLYRQRNEGKGTAPGGDSWVWLTSSSRIPEITLKSYCKKIHQYCPPGRPGPVGPPGVPGPRGDPGIHGGKGYPGVPGQMGIRGFPGYPGRKGDMGGPGLDGRDGIPGEPGLDGIPGRNGLDGLSGNDGAPGKDGVNGLDGAPGLVGPKGNQGEKGKQGLSGPKGPGGTPGMHGAAGIPGICAYEFQDEFLVPPSIADSQKEPIGPIIVNEGENVRLVCSAGGKPEPQITWLKLGPRPINRGSWQDTAVSGPILNLTRIHRDHMGFYECIAHNGIKNPAKQIYNLEVNFSPLINITNLVIRGTIGSKAILECVTEAFPEPVRYWVRSDNLLIENGTKYIINNITTKLDPVFRIKMELTINKVDHDDFQYSYHCVCKNEIGEAWGTIELNEEDSIKWGHHFPFTTNKPSVYGPTPPDKVSMEDLCGPPVHCQDCSELKDVKCSAGVSLINLISRWEIRQYGEKKFDANLTRSMDCVLNAVGKPVYHRHTNLTYGCWMQDSHPLNNRDSDKFWETQEKDPFHLFQYDNKTIYRKNITSRNYTLNPPFYGNSQVVYNGSFYYHANGTASIIKFNLHSLNYTELKLPINFNENLTKLYTEKHNLMDFSVDDNGLWVVFPVQETNNNTAIMKVNAELMEPEYIWNVSINHQKVGEMFIVCGVLYAIDSIKEKTTKIRFALDLYKNQLLDVNLTFSNPFRLTTMVEYNHRSQELYTWDSGNQLTYPVRYNEIGYNTDNVMSKEEKNKENDKIKEILKTGFEVFGKKNRINNI